jgi:hypothetical protein
MGMVEKMLFCVGFAWGCIVALVDVWLEPDGEQTCEVLDEVEYVEEPRLRIYRGGEEE